MEETVTSGPACSRDREPILGSNDDRSFKPLKTIRAFSIHLSISTVISFIGIIMASAYSEEKRCKAYYIMLYLRAIFSLITFFFDHLVHKHHKKLRLNGYHEFYRETAYQKGIPMSVVSLWNTVLIAVVTLIHHYYGESFWQHCAGFSSPIVYVTAFNVTETIILAITHGCYIAEVLKFNKAAHPPDALRGDNRPSGSLGVVQPGANTAELLEKQADIIAYLKNHNHRLTMKLHQMQQRLMRD